MILSLSGLDLDDEVRKGGEADREQRQYDLDDASATLTREISERWRQKKYEVRLLADGQHFYTFVKDEKDPALIRLEERSKGFQWFFSFDLMFMHESRGTFKDCVILLDEPGLHLHPGAQKDLLERLEMEQRPSAGEEEIRAVSERQLRPGLQALDRRADVRHVVVGCGFHGLPARRGTFRRPHRASRW